MQCEHIVSAMRIKAKQTTDEGKNAHGVPTC